MVREQLDRLRVIGAVVKASVNRGFVRLECIGTDIEASRRCSPSDLRDEVFGMDAVAFAEMPCDCQF